MRRMTLTAVMAALLVAGCANKTEDVLEAWKAAGEAPNAFAEAGEKLPGGKCQAGTVSGLDTTLCSFDDAERATAAQEAGWALVGSNVGTSVASGKVVLVVADTRKEDPTGRRINTIVKAFQKETR